MNGTHIQAAELQPLPGCGVLGFCYREIEYAWIVCPLGPQRLDCHDGLADDRNGGVFDSIARGPDRPNLGEARRASQFAIRRAPIVRGRQ
jgi:hypothetical protein